MCCGGGLLTAFYGVDFLQGNNPIFAPKPKVEWDTSPGTIVAQAAHETGNFTSMLYKEYNNPFGMKFPHVRETTAKGSAYGYCTYEDISTIKKLITAYAVSFEEDYRDAVEIIAHVSVSNLDEFTGLITESTAGRAGFVIQY